ncbi:MAG: hypothetical protein RIS53_429 [Bacillota bacterium]|jgi:hypothetical protein
MKNRTTQWFRIDNAGKLFPIITETRRSSYFRMSVILNELVDPVILQIAAEKTLIRFPHFNTKLQRGLFWNYLENQSRPFKVLPEPNTFGSNSRPFDSSKHLIEVYFHRNRISIEVFHAISDGRGGMEFLKTLTLSYLREKGYTVDSEGIMFDADDQVTHAELEDSFASKVSKGKSAWLASNKAYHLKGTYFEHNGHYLTHLHLNTEACILIARQLQTTVTGLFATILILGLIKKQEIENPRKRKPIILSIPVDMRKYLPSKTMKNFVMTINIGKVFSSQSTFEEVLQEVNLQLKEGQKIEVLAPQIRANMKAERMLLLRFVPLFIKRWIVKSVFNRVGEPALSFTMSNLGKIEMPTTTQPYLNHFEFMICSTPIMPINLGIASYKDELVLSFSRIIDDRTFIEYFVQYLVNQLKLKVTVSGNRWEESE